MGNEYYLAAITFYNKDYDAAIDKAKSLLPVANESFQGKLNRLIGDAYLQKGDSLSAQKTMDEYAAKVGEAKLELNDYKLLSEIYGRLKLADSTAQAQNDAKALTYPEKYATADTAKDADRFESVAKAYAAAHVYDKAGEWYQRLLDLKLEKKRIRARSTTITWALITIGAPLPMPELIPRCSTRPILPLGAWQRNFRILPPATTGEEWPTPVKTWKPKQA
ncbi:hypothetical protein MKQ70_33210 [Chitinophaga sedimenti]|uniref:hypothetical protein n=1 Tax=Chitinophaga sedimenti TaxID=2033606 RepID=UPI0020065422|nr:hypothetical protein [Chitinophaga sedimenti]MCK7559553.1 hypothetical protein [Chitinophaga sedimenti]